MNKSFFNGHLVCDYYNSLESTRYNYKSFSWLLLQACLLQFFLETAKAKKEQIFQNLFLNLEEHLPDISASFKKVRFN